MHQKFLNLHTLSPDNLPFICNFFACVTQLVLIPTIVWPWPTVPPLPGERDAIDSDPCRSLIRDNEKYNQWHKKWEIKIKNEKRKIKIKNKWKIWNGKMI